MNILITGGAGFIGSALIRHLINNTEHSVINVDKLTYAGNLESLDPVASSDRLSFEQADICDQSAISGILDRYQPDAVMHLAAESHVDRSIDGPGEFMKTNLMGTYTLLEACRQWIDRKSEEERRGFRFLHVSTDEVYGDLEADDDQFSESNPYQPSSPYAATKAGSDHLVRAWHRTFQFPCLVTNCSNNYGPYQFPEKLIPHMILNALAGKPLPVYGDGSQIRDWLHVEDHARALTEVLLKGTIGETYNVGGWNEVRNIDVVRMICGYLEEFRPEKPDGLENYHDLITYVTDRPGHDTRYAINAEKIHQELGWKPAENFGTGLRSTVKWYLDNEPWWSRVLDGSYQLERIGTES